MATELRFLFNQHHLGAGTGGRDRRRHAGRSTAGDENVGMGVALVVISGRGADRNAATSDEAFEDVAIKRPPTSRLDKGLVIKARSQEAAEDAVDGFQVEVERGPGVARRDLHAAGDAPMGAAHVGFVADLDDAIGVEVSGGHDTARTMVLEAA